MVLSCRGTVLCVHSGELFIRSRRTTLISLTQSYHFQSVPWDSSFCHRSRSFACLRFMCVRMGQDRTCPRQLFCLFVEIRKYQGLHRQWLTSVRNIYKCLKSNPQTGARLDFKQTSLTSMINLGGILFISTHYCRTTWTGRAPLTLTQSFPQGECTVPGCTAIPGRCMEWTEQAPIPSPRSKKQFNIWSPGRGRIRY